MTFAGADTQNKVAARWEKRWREFDESPETEKQW
jgi:hypothetical protein